MSQPAQDIGPDDTDVQAPAYRMAGFAQLADDPTAARAELDRLRLLPIDHPEFDGLRLWALHYLAEGQAVPDLPQPQEAA